MLVVDSELCALSMGEAEWVIVSVLIAKKESGSDAGDVYPLWKSIGHNYGLN